MALWKDLKIYKKTTKYYELRFTRNGLSIPITGWKIFFTMKTNRSDTENDAVIKKDITSHLDPLAGKSLITLSVEDTDKTAGVYWYDVRYITDEDDTGILYEGRLKVELPVTQRVA